MAETRKNLEQLKDENTFFDPLLTPQQPFLLCSGVNQQSGMRCRRNARLETNHCEIAAVFCHGSLHRDVPHRRHLLSSSSSAYDQNQTGMIFLHSI